MNDPERLTRRPSNTTTGALMRAGLAERPSPASLRRTAQAVAAFAGVGSATGATVAAEVARAGAASATGLSVAPSAAIVTPALLVKWLALGAGGGVLLSFGVHRAVAPPPRSPTGPVPAVSAAPTSVSKSPGTPAAKPNVREPASEPRVASGPQAASGAERAASAPVATTAPRGRATAGTPQGATAAELAAEVALVDQSRSLLNASEASAALAALRGYEAQFPNRQLYTEVLAVRMEAAHALGNEADARVFASRLLGRGVARPLAERARSLLAE